jgi:hypothetical protein
VANAISYRKATQKLFQSQVQQARELRNMLIEALIGVSPPLGDFWSNLHKKGGWDLGPLNVAYLVALGLMVKETCSSEHLGI